MDLKLELEVSGGAMGRIWQCSMETDLEEREAEFLSKYVKFEAMMEHHLITHLSIYPWLTLCFLL